MEMSLDMVNHNVQETLKEFQDTKNKEYKKTQKQINELIGALNKHQSETESTINRLINELKTKIDNIKEEVTHNMENLRKKNETEIKTNHLFRHLLIDVKLVTNKADDIPDLMEYVFL
jgi:chromosome segregation ATPase